MIRFIKVFALLCLISVKKVRGQDTVQPKSHPDYNTIETWPSLHPGSVTNDGKYVTYTTDNLPRSQKSLFFASTLGSWRTSIVEGKDESFCGDDKFAVFFKGDSLGLVKLGSSSIKFFGHVSNWKISNDATRQFFAFGNPLVKNSISLIAVQTGECFKFDSVTSYSFSKSGNLLVFRPPLKSGSDEFAEFEIISLASGRPQVGARVRLKSATIVGGPLYNEDGTCFAIVCKNTDGRTVVSKYALPSGHLLSSIDVTGYLHAKRLMVHSLQTFAFASQSIYVLLKRANPVAPFITSDVWSYGDNHFLLNSKKVTGSDSYWGILNFGLGNLKQLEFDNEKLIRSGNLNNCRFAVISQERKDRNVFEWNWDTSAPRTCILIDVLTGKRQILLRNYQFRQYGNSAQVSPRGKFVTYYDSFVGAYFSYETATGIVRNFVRNIRTDWTEYYRSDRPMSTLDNRGILCWTPDDSRVLIYDRYNIWLIDPLGLASPRNLTSHQQSTHEVVYYSYTSFSEPSNPWICIFFDRKTKENGFVAVSRQGLRNPKILIKDSALFCIPENPYLPINSGFVPLKAKNASVYILTRSTSNEFPNLYVTTNFITLARITNVNPQMKHIYLKAELAEFHDDQGRLRQGLLYKPDNFDSTYSYPLILHFYERKSDGLYSFPGMGYSDGDLNVAYFVSNGFLVFEPDIDFTLGEPGGSFLRTVESSIKWLSKLRYVDTSRLGLQGHSFGGYGAAYVLTHSSRFRAVCVASGLYDLNSAYGSLFQDGSTKHYIFEVHQLRLGSPPWDGTDTYLKNSPINTVRNVTAPLLMMHNPKDEVCPFTNAVEFFTAMRRFGKPVWLLHYQNGSHTISGSDAKDFTAKMYEFFSFYLKDQSKRPHWMGGAM